MKEEIKELKKELKLKKQEVKEQIKKIRKNKSIFNESDSDTIMNINEASDYLDISKATFYKWLSENKIKGFKIGGQWRFHKTTLEEFVYNEHSKTINFNIVNEFENILKNAILKDASDIHFEPVNDKIKIRMRVKGKLEIFDISEKYVKFDLISTIKKVSGLNNDINDYPQHSNIFSYYIEQQNQWINCIASVLPVWGGEKIVLRIMNPIYSENIKLENIVKSKEKLNKITTFLEKPYGIVIFSGPTGSGKTTTLYSALEYLKKDSVNIMSVENPIYYHLEGIYQTQINAENNYGYNKAISSVLAQDPDIISIADISEDNVMEIALKSALNGHLVLSQFHALNIYNLFNKIYNMKIDKSEIIEALIGITSQRLLRKLCDNCKVEYELPAFLVNEYNLKTNKSYIEKGCDKCILGFKGRLAIYDIFDFDGEIKELLLNDKFDEIVNDKELNKLNGNLSLFKSGLNEVLKGNTSIIELCRVLGLFRLKSQIINKGV